MQGSVRRYAAPLQDAVGPGKAKKLLDQNKPLGGKTLQFNRDDMARIIVRIENVNLYEKSNVN
jgi:hypothetical protein